MAQQNGTPGAPQLLSGGAAAAQPQAPPAAAPQPPQPPQPPAADQANGAGSGAPRGPLIGRAGFLHISESLKKDGPDRTIADMQRLHGLSHPLCRPLLELTDHLQVRLGRLGCWNGCVAYAYACACAFECMCVAVLVYMKTVYMCVYLCVCVCVCVWVGGWVRVHACTR
jgi:hypothetical protein